MLKSVGETEGSELAELFLTTIAGLYDPHSTYFSADTYEDFGIQMKLELVGIGAMLGTEDDTCVVREIVPGGPADLDRQLKPNDKIIAVAQGSGEPVEIIGMKLRKIVDMIRGSKGTQRAPDRPARQRDRLLSAQGDRHHARRREARLGARPRGRLPGARRRRQEPCRSASSRFRPSTGPATRATPTATSRARARMSPSSSGSSSRRGIQGLVLDLRHNGGGFLSEAIELAGLFIHKGPVVQVKDYEGDIQVDSDRAENLSYDGPMAVLVDRFSASASEIVAGALQDYGRAVVIGDNSTHGKGSVQTVVEMRRFAPQLATSPVKTGAAKITIQKFYLPDGSSTQLRGVVSDIVLPSVDEFLPIGESDLPHALVWDKIRTSSFRGAPIDHRVLARLQLLSTQRQESLAGVRVRAQVRRLVQGPPGPEAGLAKPGGAPQAEGRRTTGSARTAS